MSTGKRRGFLGGAAILAGAVAITKLIGAVYKIPLGNLLGKEGMGPFQAAYNVYSVLLTVSTAGLRCRGSWPRRTRSGASTSAGASSAWRWVCFSCWG